MGIDNTMLVLMLSREESFLAVYFAELCEIKSQAYYLGGIRIHNLCNSRAASYNHIVLKNNNVPFCVLLLI